jgi:hypothetical protein
MRYAPGQWVVHRHFTRDRLESVRLARVVAHDEAGLLIWVHQGSPVVVRHTLDGRNMRDMPFDEWVEQPTELVPATWLAHSVLMFLPAGAAHSVWWFWSPTGEFEGWYVNLEEPNVFWDHGVDTVDQDLDIVVHADRTWQWKDEDEFTERLAFPDHYWVSDGPAVWAEGNAMVKLIESGAFPFDGTWCDWRPGDGWQAPPMPEGWDRPRVLRP